MSLVEHKIWAQWAAAELPSKKPLPELQQLAARELSPQTDVDTLVDWLVRGGWLTSFQAEVMSQNAAAALRFGDFVLLDRPASVIGQRSFVARHLPTNRDFLLDFFDPNWARTTRERLATWDFFQLRLENLASLDHGHLVPCLGSVESPEYSFVISDWSEAGLLADKLPRKTRMTWEMAAQFGVQLADAIAAIHSRDIAVGGWSVADVLLVGKQRAMLRVPWLPNSQRWALSTGTGEQAGDYLPPEFAGRYWLHEPRERQTSDLETEQAADWYSLGCFLQRLIAGRLSAAQSDPEQSIAEQTKNVKPRSVQASHRSDDPDSRLESTDQQMRRPVDWKKYNVPEAASALIESLLSNHNRDRIRAGGKLVDTFVNLLNVTRDRVLTGASISVANQQLRRRWSSVVPDLLPNARKQVELQPSQLQVFDLSQEANLRGGGNDLSSNNPNAVLAKRPTRRRRGTPWLAWGASLAILLITVAVALPWMQQKNVSPLADGDSATTDPSAVQEGTSSSTELAETTKTLEMTHQILLQEVVPDDGQLPWESPTAGSRFPFAWHPPGARMLVAMRPHGWLAQEESQLVLKSLGPGVANWIDELRRITGMELEDFSTLSIALYSQAGQPYEPFLTATLIEPITEARWRELTQSAPVVSVEAEEGNPVSGTDVANTKLWSRESFHFLTVPPAGVTDRVIQFVLGSQQLVQQARELGPVESLAGPLAQLADRCDADRHVSVIFLPPALFNDEGQALMSGVWAPLNRWLRAYVDENIRSGLLSLHWQDGCYVELWLEHARDIKSADLLARVQDQIRQIRDQLTTQLTSLAASPHWDRVRGQMFGMVGDFWRRLRFGVEQNQVLVNGWLPPMAAHNLLAGAELGLYFSSGGKSIAASARPKTPQSLDELLQTPRNLQVTTNPDLNLLLQSIQTEIREQYPSLPFPFEIQLVGNDLVIEGITQNQRPGDFEMQNSKLADILTEIMLRANPDKSATGPADPKCKLVWVIAESDTSGVDCIKITTRAAAAEKNWELPDVFKQLK